MSVVGQHMQQAGATPAEAMAFTLCSAVQNAEDCIARGMNPDHFLPRFTFLATRLARFVAVLLAGFTPSFFARRSSRYRLMRAFGTSWCLAHTIPKIGAAGLRQ